MLIGAHQVQLYRTGADLQAFGNLGYFQALQVRQQKRLAHPGRQGVEHTVKQGQGFEGQQADFR
ncbi:hypothetical protein D3C80_1970440 [compost metagenome]